jgi:hypothetical protein
LENSKKLNGKNSLFRRANSGVSKVDFQAVHDFSKRKGSEGHFSKLMRRKTMNFDSKRRKGNKSVGFKSPEGSVKYVERVWSPKNYRNKSSMSQMGRKGSALIRRKSPSVVTHLENQPPIFRPHTAAPESRSEVPWKIHSKKASYNFNTHRALAS